jgi:hypothetical protein
MSTALVAGTTASAEGATVTRFRFDSSETMAALLVLAPGQASAATLNVCPSGCPYTQLAPALAAAHHGDTIRIGPGTYDGGVTIDVSVKLVGAGAVARSSPAAARC